tara:strand:+ start:337 stop:663 length:327 start_codon:yes stop_codon:yes gene_type:complete
LKVGELKVGMMITPIVNRWTKERMSFNIKECYMTRENPKTGKEEAQIATVCDIASGLRPGIPKVGIYMGREKSEFWINGVKTHHNVLIGNTLAKISGYEFRWIESAEQ